MRGHPMPQPRPVRVERIGLSLCLHVSLLLLLLSLSLYISFSLGVSLIPLFHAVPLQVWEASLKELIIQVPIGAEDDSVVQHATRAVRDFVAARLCWLRDGPSTEEDRAQFKKSLEAIMKFDGGEIPWAPAPPKAQSSTPNAEPASDGPVLDLETPEGGEKEPSKRQRVASKPHVFRFLQTETAVWTVLEAARLQ